MENPQMNKTPSWAEKMWLLAGLVCFFSGVVLVVARFVAEKNGVPIWSIVVLFVCSAVGLFLSDIYATIVAQPPPKEPPARAAEDVLEMEPDDEMALANQVSQPEPGEVGLDPAGEGAAPAFGLDAESPFGAQMD